MHFSRIKKKNPEGTIETSHGLKCVGGPRRETVWYRPIVVMRMTMRSTNYNL
jgi:hypothetical protein